MSGHVPKHSRRKKCSGPEKMRITHPNHGLGRVGYFRFTSEITTAITATINDPKVTINDNAS